MNKTELQVWELIKQYPEELGFVLQEKNYASYCETYRNPETDTIDPAEIVLTEEQFNTIKKFFNQRERRE